MIQAKILVIDDDPVLAESMVEGISSAGYLCKSATTGTEGMELLRNEEFDVIVTDLVLHDFSGLDIIRAAQSKLTKCEVIVITGYPDENTAQEALEAGAYDYIGKPIRIGILRVKIKKALEKLEAVRSNIELRLQIDKQFGFEGIVGKTREMQGIFDTLRQISDTTATVLIYGESGTGKELIARAIHMNSRRRDKHFVPLNCAALSESVLESELFGHEKGAFTGATYQRKGRFEFAHNGTLFLDEIGDMPITTQVKLLRVIENGEIIRVGSNEAVKVDVRLIAATNRKLESLIRENKFREDLYFRINVVTIDIPPLRERMDDLPNLIDYFIKGFSSIHQKRIKDISPAALEILSRYSWPGNIRELRNCIESMIVIAQGERLDANDIPGHILHNNAQTDRQQPDSGGLMDAAEKELIKATLAKFGGNREAAAKTLGIGERTLYRKIKQYGLS